VTRAISRPGKGVAYESQDAATVSALPNDNPLHVVRAGAPARLRAGRGPSADRARVAGGGRDRRAAGRRGRQEVRASRAAGGPAGRPRWRGRLPGGDVAAGRALRVLAV